MNNNTIYRAEKPIVLIGLMGAGKTTIGKKLAELLEIEFIDSDDEIANAAGCSIPDIFAIYGEPIFRDLECRVITRLMTEGGEKIIATGGGAWMNLEIQKIIKKRAISVWLKADLPTLLERISRKNTRPLLENGNKREIMQKLLNERYPEYIKATITIESAHSSHENIANNIIDSINLHLC